jgi:hypothetical protein
MLKITDQTRTFTVLRNETISLELKLNVTRVGHAWKGIGDHLFYFANRPDTSDLLTVTPEQYDFLVLLHSNPSRESCRDL